MLVVAIFCSFALATACHDQAPKPEFIATISPTDTPSPMSTSVQEPALVEIAWPTPTPEPTPIVLAPVETPEVVAAAAEPVRPIATPVPVQPKPQQAGVPWYIPPSWIARWQECLTTDYRHDVSTYVWRVSIQGGNSEGWDYEDAMYIVQHEGGDDFCQFNTQGSGACGPFQLLTCPQDGLTPEGQIRGAYAKWRDGGGSFQRHWFAFWR